MKRVTIYIAHLLVLVLTGCDKTVLEFPENGGVDPTLVNVNLTLAIDPKIESYVPAERSKASEADLYDVRWIVEVFRDEIAGEPVQRYVLGCEQAADGHHTIHTSLALHAARYHVVAWMDYVDDGSVSDKYYTIPSLSAISVPEAGSYIGNEEHKDTYVARQEIDLKGYRDRWNETVDATVTLQRPMAKIEFITTDIDKFLDELAVRRPKMTGAVAGDLLSKAPDLSTIRVQVDYAGYFPSGFNAYTNKPNDARTGMGFGCNMTPLTGKEAHLASDYIFVNGSESAVKVNLTIRDSEGNLLNRIEGIDVPIVRGKLTTIRDEFLTRDYAPGIGIDPGFNAYTNKPNDARTGMGFGCNMTPLTGKEAHLASDYIFVNGSESAVKVNLTIRDSEGNLLNRIEGIDVPIVRGKLTTIRDEFLTRDYAPGIGIDPGFEGDINITIPD